MSPDEGYTIRDKYQKPVDYEQLLFNQMNRIAMARSQSNLENFQSSVNTLVIMLPKELRDKAQAYIKKNKIGYGLSAKQKQLYDSLWEYINEILEGSNLIFRTSYIKTYE